MKVVKIALKTHEIAPFLKNFWGACPQTPLAKARSFAARDMPLRGMYIQNPRNFKVGPPPLRNPAYAPAISSKVNINVSMYKFINYVKLFLLENIFHRF